MSYENSPASPVQPGLVSPSSSPEGWYEDPLGRHHHRYFDGDQWTEHVADNGTVSVDPLKAEVSAGVVASTQQESVHG